MIAREHSSRQDGIDVAFFNSCSSAAFPSVEGNINAPLLLATLTYDTFSRLDEPVKIYITTIHFCLSSVLLILFGCFGRLWGVQGGLSGDLLGSRSTLGAKIGLRAPRDPPRPLSEAS